MRAALRARGIADTAAALTVVVNTGDDLWLSGVRLQPDVDSIVYALAGVNDARARLGPRGRHASASTTSCRSGAPAGRGSPSATSTSARTSPAPAGCATGSRPTQVIERMSQRWPLGARLLPMTDAEVDTDRRAAGRLAPALPGVVDAPPRDARARAVREPRASRRAAAAPGVAEAIAAADVVLIAPSNPVVSIGPILAVPGIREALAATSAPVVGVSPIIGGRVVRGMADVCLAAIGVETSAAAVAAHYGARADGGLLDAWLLAEEDAAAAPPGRGSRHPLARRAAVDDGRGALRGARRGGAARGRGVTCPS